MTTEAEGLRTALRDLFMDLKVYEPGDDPRAWGSYIRAAVALYGEDVLPLLAAKPTPPPVVEPPVCDHGRRAEAMVPCKRVPGSWECESCGRWLNDPKNRSDATPSPAPAEFAVRNEFPRVSYRCRCGAIVVNETCEACDPKPEPQNATSRGVCGTCGGRRVVPSASYAPDPCPACSPAAAKGETCPMPPTVGNVNALIAERDALRARVEHAEAEAARYRKVANKYGAMVDAVKTALKGSDQ